MSELLTYMAKPALSFRPSRRAFWFRLSPRSGRQHKAWGASPRIS